MASSSGVVSEEAFVEVKNSVARNKMAVALVGFFVINLSLAITTAKPFS